MFQHAAAMWKVGIVMTKTVEADDGLAVYLEARHSITHALFRTGQQCPQYLDEIFERCSLLVRERRQMAIDH